MTFHFEIEKKEKTMYLTKEPELRAEKRRRKHGLGIRGGAEKEEGEEKKEDEDQPSLEQG